MQIELGEQEKGLTLKDSRPGDIVCVGDSYCLVITDIPGSTSVSTVLVARLIGGDVRQFPSSTKMFRYSQAKLTLGPKE